MFIGFEVSGPVPVHQVIIDTVGDGEAAWVFTLGGAPGQGQSDARAFRGLAVKPVVEGHWGLVVRAIDDRGCLGESAPGPAVDVVR